MQKNTHISIYVNDDMTFVEKWKYNIKLLKCNFVFFCSANHVQHAAMETAKLRFTFTVTAVLVTVIFLLTIFPQPSHGHGRLIEPPSRASAWRYGFQTPPNYNDHELYCGGFTRQQRNGGKCGECGDAWDVPLPRPNEYGGRWGQGVVVRKYNPSSDITLRVELTASHMGWVHLLKHLT